MPLGARSRTRAAPAGSEPAPAGDVAHHLGDDGVQRPAAAGRGAAARARSPRRPRRSHARPPARGRPLSPPAGRRRSSRPRRRAPAGRPAPTGHGRRPGEPRSLGASENTGFLRRSQVSSSGSDLGAPSAPTSAQLPSPASSVRRRSDGSAAGSEAWSGAWASSDHSPGSRSSNSSSTRADGVAEPRRPAVGLAAEHALERLEQPPLAGVVLADHGRDVGLELERGRADPAVPLDPEGRELHR